MRKTKVNKRIRIKHKPFMSKRHYVNKCIGCKYHECDSFKGFLQKEVANPIMEYTDSYLSESDVPDDYFDDVCTYPYTDRCMKNSWSYRIGTVLALIVLLTLIALGCMCLYGLLRVAWFLFKFVMNLIS